MSDFVLRSTSVASACVGRSTSQEISSEVTFDRGSVKFITKSHFASPYRAGLLKCADSTPNSSQLNQKRFPLRRASRRTKARSVSRWISVWFVSRWPAVVASTSGVKPARDRIAATASLSVRSLHATALSSRSILTSESAPNTTSNEPEPPCSKCISCPYAGPFTKHSLAPAAATNTCKSEPCPSLLSLRNGKSPPTVSRLYPSRYCVG